MILPVRWFRRGLHIDFVSEGIILWTNLVGITLLTNLDPKIFLCLVCIFGINLPGEVLFESEVSCSVIVCSIVLLGNEISCSA